MSHFGKRVCPVEISGILDNRIRRWLQNPQKILGHYIKEGMMVLDLGCGPGSFSIDIARMVGKSGRVIAADLQEGMLQKLKGKIQGTELEKRITLHKCEETRIGLLEKVDFILAFYMVHEVPDQDRFLNEVWSTLKANGQFLMVEPTFRVSKAEFEKTIAKAVNLGFAPVERPKLFLSKAVVLKKE